MSWKWGKTSKIVLPSGINLVTVCDDTYLEWRVMFAVVRLKVDGGGKICATSTMTAEPRLLEEKF